MKAIILLIASGFVFLSSAPAAASEYADCLKSYQSSRGLGLGNALGTMRASRNYSFAIRDSISYSSNYYYSNPISFISTGFGGWGNAPVVSAMARACRHLKQVKQPAYRITSIKSPTMRNSVNTSGEESTR